MSYTRFGNKTMAGVSSVLAQARMMLAAVTVLCLPTMLWAGNNHLGFDLSNASVPVSRIEHGGPPRDGIPALTNPPVIAASKADYLRADDRVLGIVVAGQARAYPVRILNWHEIVNDQLAGQALVVTWCPLCGTGMIFDGDFDGQRRNFGVSGLLYNSDVLLYDRATESLWSQVLAVAISGPLRGEKLKLLPAIHTSWQDWLERYPDSEVLGLNTGYQRDYGRDPYAGYAASSDLYFSVSKRDQRFHPKALVAGLLLDGEAMAWPLEQLDSAAVLELQDTVAGQPITLSYDKEHRSVAIADAAGNALPVIIAYWFAWVAFYPDTGVYPQ
jgi:YD repeat-containing protein